MKFSIAAALFCLAPTADAFLASPNIVGRPALLKSSKRDSTTMVLGLPEALAGTVQSSAIMVAASGVGEPGSVDAPGWVLPVGAGVVILLAGAIPLLLKPGDDAAKGMQDRDRDTWEQNMK